VDLDPQGNATSGLGFTPENDASLYNAMLGHGEAGNLVKPTAWPNLYILPSEKDLAGSEVEIARVDSYLHCFNRALGPILAAGNYDFVFIDCPPALGILTMNAMAASSSILIPMQCEYYALEGLAAITQVTRQLRETGANPSIDIEGILMTMYARTNLSLQVIDEVRKHFDKAVYETVIPRNIRLSAAPSHGKPVQYYDPSSTGADAYRKLAREFMTRHGLLAQSPEAHAGEKSQGQPA
jgi:chromosome partitioning protein